MTKLIKANNIPIVHGICTIEKPTSCQYAARELLRYVTNMHIEKVKRIFPGAFPPMLSFPSSIPAKMKHVIHFVWLNKLANLVLLPTDHKMDLEVFLLELL